MRQLIPRLTAATVAFGMLAGLPAEASAQGSPGPVARALPMVGAPLHATPVHWGDGGGYGRGYGWGGYYAPPPPPPWYGRPQYRGYYGGGYAPPPYAYAPPPRWGGGGGWYR